LLVKKGGIVSIIGGWNLPPNMGSTFVAKNLQSGDPLVVKSNHIIEASYRLSVAEQRILLTAISRLRRGQYLTDATLYSVSAAEIADMCGTSMEGAYRDLSAAAERLFERRITILKHPDGSRQHERQVTRWVQDVVYKPGEGRVEFRFGKTILPYLSELTEQFTRYALSDVAKMTSAYAIRLFEILIQWDSIGKRELEIDQLREWLQLEDRYSSIKDFKKWVVDPAVEQINEHSPLTVTWDQRKTGRKVTHLIFTFERKAVELEKPQQKQESAERPRSINEAELSRLAYPGESTDSALRRLNAVLA